MVCFILINYMAYTYDTSSYEEKFMMLGSSKVFTLDSTTKNYKKLTCTEFTSHVYDMDRYYIGGIPMVAHRMSNGRSAIRIIDVTRIFGLHGTFSTSNNEKTTLNGCSVLVAGNGRNDYILSLQKLNQTSTVPSSSFTDFSGFTWLLDTNKSLAVVTTTQQPISFKKFMFGNKLLICGEYNDGFSPVARIDSTVV
jgi:hypothetical protein